MEPTTYSRRFLRIKPVAPIYGEIRIVHIGGRKVLSNRARVRLLDICAGGVRFASVLKLPADSKVILELSMELDGIRYRFEGHIVSYLNVEVREYEYGFCFAQPEMKLRKVLMKIFNSTSAMQDRYIILRMSQGKSN